MSNLLIKICGIKDQDTALAVARANAQFVGLVFHPDSKRYVDIAKAKEITAVLNSTLTQPVGVFVNHSAEEIASICQQTNIKIAQLHGDNARAANKILPNPIQRIYVLHVDQNGEINNKSAQFLQYCDPQRDFILIDTGNGEGKSFAWDKFNFPYKNYRWFLAGGLGTQNVKKAVEILKPNGVDVSSGVENESGKDVGKIGEFICSVATPILAFPSVEKESFCSPSLSGEKESSCSPFPLRGKVRMGAGMEVKINKKENKFGGIYMPELFMAPIHELISTWNKLKDDQKFNSELQNLLVNYAGRATPLTEVPQFAKAINGPRIFLKREDLLHTGAHKLNNALGQCLLAKKMGKTRIIAETGAGQHGVATAAACAHLGLECVVYMGQKDIERQASNVLRMRMLNAKVVSVKQGSATLKEAINEALRDWSESFEHTHYCLGSALGPHPYPEIVATFQSVIGKETYEQSQQQFGNLPNLIIACVGGGSNAIGIFSPFIHHSQVRLIGVEAGGHGAELGQHAARFKNATPGVLHGCYTFVLQDEMGQIAQTASISAGLDYPAVSPQHAELFVNSRVEYVSVSDHEAVKALYLLAKTEGIIAALESSHALAYLIKIAPSLPKNTNVIVNLSGRGDKDLPQLAELNYEQN